MLDIARIVSKLPAWVLVVVAGGCVAGGAVLTLQPFTSVEVLVLVAGLVAVVTGVLTLISPNDHARLHRWLIGSGWVVLGVVVLAWPGLGVEALATVVGAALVAAGVADIVKAATRRVEPWVELIGGAAAIAFGLLALGWPDVTVFVVGVLFGARTVLFGLSQLVLVVERRRHPERTAAVGPASPESHSLLRRFGRLAVRSAALLLAIALLATSVAFRRDEATVPDFYDTPAEVPATPGELIRTEPFTTGIPDNAHGRLILYSTTTATGGTTVASAIVLLPEDPPADQIPVIAWTHGTVGIDRRCAPSLAAQPFANVPAMGEALNNGWAVVATDYAGMGTEGVSPYLIGRGQAYSALDAVRAARRLPGAPLSSQVVVWGHSQGGHAALWTGMVAEDYAPGLTIDGVAALAPATDLIALADAVQHKPGGALGSAYVGTAYGGTYDDVHLDDYIRPGARVAVTEAAHRCVTDPSLLASAIVSGPAEQSVVRGDFTSGPLGTRLRQNTPTADVPAPLLVGQGTSDEVIPVAITRRWVPEQCAAGHEVDFRTYPGRDHLSLVAPGSPLIDDLTRWTIDRLAGASARSTC